MENKKEESRKVPVKNYIILAAIMIAGMALTIYLCNWYNAYEEYERQTPVIRGTLSEITAEELDHYVMENPTSVIYLCTASDDKCRYFEKDLTKLVIQKSLQQAITYVNLSDTDSASFIENFNNTYSYKVKLTSEYPAFVIFEEGRITNILQGSETEALTISKTKQFIELYKIGE